MVGITTGEEWMKAECEGENETWVEIKSEGIIDNLITLRLMSPRGDFWKKKRVIYADGNWRGKKKLKEKKNTQEVFNDVGFAFSLEWKYWWF